MADKPVKKSMYEEDMERMTKSINKPLPSNYPVGRTDSSGMTLMPNGNWRNPEGKVFTHVKPTVNLPPKDEEVEGKKRGGSIRSSASKRADGIAQRGKTRGTMIMCMGGKTK